MSSRSHRTRSRLCLPEHPGAIYIVLEAMPWSTLVRTLHGVSATNPTVDPWTGVDRDYKLHLTVALNVAAPREAEEHLFSVARFLSRARGGALIHEATQMITVHSDWCVENLALFVRTIVRMQALLGSIYNYKRMSTGQRFEVDALRLNHTVIRESSTTGIVNAILRSNRASKSFCHVPIGTAGGNLWTQLDALAVPPRRRRAAAREHR